MKTILKRISYILLVVSLCINCTACGDSTVEADLWSTAIYTEDTEFGNGGKTIFLEVQAENRSVEFTIKTNADIVGDALSEHDLVSGEEGAYGLYIKTVNGITADYDQNQSYWSFEQNGEYMMTGVDKTELTDGAHYELIYTK